MLILLALLIIEELCSATLTVPIFFSKQHEKMILRAAWANILNISRLFF